ncbi:MAG: DUF4097 family beta strand repeat protein [Calditrichae bacterium]|nr:DUF4097 family beta strand repeat protein [Calditrichia bacterium]NIV72693.1 DUF4097 family beta strand repeat protein [Calditrichia bacterium]
MKRSTFFILLSILFLLDLEVSSAQEITEQNGKYVANLVQTFDVSSGGQLIASGVSGDISVHSWNKESLEIREILHLDVFTKEEAREIVERTKSGYSVEGNTVKVTGQSGRHWIQQRFEITVPKKFNIDLMVINGDIVVENIAGTTELRTTNGDVEVNNIAGETNLSTSAGDLDANDIDGPLKASTSGGEIRLEKLKGLVDARTAGGDISLRNAAKNVDLKTAGGEIEVQEVRGNVTAKTAGGSIEVRTCEGDVEVKTAGGDIIASDIGGNWEAQTSGGDIDGNGLNGRSVLETNGGDIELSNVRGSVRASTSAGDVDVQVTLQNFQKDHRLLLRTSVGNIRLTIPEKLPASITAEIHQNGGRWKRFDIYSNFPLSTEEVEERQVFRRTGDINGGGDEIRLEASHGDIRIMKAQ